MVSPGSYDAFVIKTSFPNAGGMVAYTYRFFSLVQYQNALSPISVTSFGILKLTKDVQRLKALDSILVMPSCSTTSFSEH